MEALSDLIDKPRLPVAGQAHGPTLSRDEHGHATFGRKARGVQRHQRGQDQWLAHVRAIANCLLASGSAAPEKKCTDSSEDSIIPRISVVAREAGDAFIGHAIAVSVQLVRRSCAASSSVASAGSAMKTVCLVLPHFLEMRAELVGDLVHHAVEPRIAGIEFFEIAAVAATRNSTYLTSGNGICCPSRRGTLTA